MLRLAEHHAERAPARLALATLKLVGVIDPEQIRVSSQCAAELSRILQSWR